MGALPGQVTRGAVLLGLAMGLLLVGLEVAEAPATENAMT